MIAPCFLNLLLVGTVVERITELMVLAVGCKIKLLFDGDFRLIAASEFSELMI